MTLLVTVVAACICTVIWYLHERARKLHLSTLCLMYWGASLMWLVDAVVEYLEVREAYFSPDPSDMLNDLFLGLSVIALGLVIWLVIMLAKDPLGTVHAALHRHQNG